MLARYNQVQLQDEAQDEGNDQAKRHANDGEIEYL